MPLMSECIFCKIVRGTAPAVKVYENEEVLVFMDKQPITRGHMLVIPKTHVELLTEADDQVTSEMFKAAKRMAVALRKSKLGSRAVNYLVADGAEAGQEVFHVHIHVIPRYRGDGFGFRMPPGYDDETSVKELENAAAKIMKVLGTQGI
ncbi:MAG TPA: HIT family protein [Candidatus Bilamarchaeum sp.]|nr:HIT family protein [Candidatus Bilamarchaeum sp.]